MAGQVRLFQPNDLSSREFSQTHSLGRDPDAPSTVRNVCRPDKAALLDGLYPMTGSEPLP